MPHTDICLLQILPSLGCETQENPLGSIKLWAEHYPVGAETQHKPSVT